MLVFTGWIQRNLITTWILQLFATLDNIAFTVFGWVMQAIFDIANAEIVKDTLYESFEDRVYVLLGIFMLFKVTVSLLGYLVNPDKIADKEKGMSKMVTRTIVVLVMLIGFPVVFDLMGRTQNALLEALPRIIIGRGSDTETLGNQMGSVTDSISWSVFKLSLEESTINTMETEDHINTVEGATSVITDPMPNDNSEFKYHYRPVMGTVLAIVMIVLLVGIAIDVAIRAFKLIILRMIAPIPIISYIDPKSSKDGAFSSWLKLLVSTWLDLFIKLGILYFVLYLLDEIIIRGGLDLTSGLNFQRSAVLIVFLIIGLLFFARQAPKFISKALGIKEGGGMGVGLGGALAGSAALLGGAGLAGAVMAGTQAMNENADAAAQGKAGTAGWSKGSDLAAQLKTGQKDAKGGLVNRAINATRKSAVQKAAGRRAAEMGLSQATLKEAKEKMLDLKNQAQIAAIELQNKGALATPDDYDRYNELLKAAGKAEANYNKANQAYSAMGLDSTWEDEHRMGTVDKLKNGYKAVRHPLTTMGEGISNIPGKVKDNFQDTIHARDGDGKRYTGREMDRRAKDAQQKNRDAFK